MECGDLTVVVEGGEGRRSVYSKTVDTGAARYVVIQKLRVRTIRLLVARSHHCVIIPPNDIISVTMFQTIIRPSDHIRSHQITSYNT